jgi:CheY-like chemotaxis protein
MIEAAEAGTSIGRLYADVVRPALEHTGAAWADAGSSAADRLVLGSVQATLAVIAGRAVEGAAMRGEGRHAVVSVGTGSLDALDGQVIVDTLCGDGWTVTEIEAGAPAGDVAGMALDRHVQLVVMPTTNAADLLLSAQTYTLLRRMADPPMIVACAFGRPADERRARAVGADAFVSTPDDLLAHVARCLPPTGGRNWGVRLRRLGETLVVSPTGDFDEGSVMRLRQVVDSRVGSFEALVIDTRDVASVATSGAGRLLEWLQGAAAAGRSHRVLPGALLRDAFAGSPLDPTLVADPYEAGA